MRALYLDLHAIALAEGILASSNLDTDHAALSASTGCRITAICGDDSPDLITAINARNGVADTTVTLRTNHCHDAAIVIAGDGALGSGDASNLKERLYGERYHA